jgi:hypothetical protein
MPIPDLAQVEIQIVQMTNAFRKENGLGALKQNAVLRRAAEEFARYLARTGKFSHQADGREPWDRAKAAGYAYCSVAENLALNMDSRGFTSAGLATGAIEGWKSSPGHRRAMLGPHSIEIGVGIAKAPGEEKYISVQLFGRPVSYQYSYRVANRSEHKVTYTIDGKSVAIEPRHIITHTECTPAALKFESIKTGFLSSQPLTYRFEPHNGASYVIRQATGGGVTVEAEARTGTR